ncbi:Ribonuclease H1 [Gigaspora margarita]|uniref:Ribonuclease H n=1 Tax=Gigaspora margarita TaxID=4874 RepID=A0A8H3WYU1_GIGMA|nr:Ribonuclease H1 [Gigaspora margarita]
MTKSKPSYYAVLNGRAKGIYKTWEEYKAQVSKFPNTKYKKFYDINEAQNFIERKNDIVKNDINGLQVWTDGSAFENGTTNTRAKAYDTSQNRQQLRREKERREDNKITTFNINDNYNDSVNAWNVVAPSIDYITVLSTILNIVTFNYYYYLILI